MGSWKLANRRQPEGALLEAPGFSSVTGVGGELRARRVSVPTEVDAQRALENAGGLASDRTRSLEFWWDGPGRRLDVVLVAERGDMPAYEQDFMSVYVNATFEDCPIHPEWYDRRYYEEEAALEDGGKEASAAILSGGAAGRAGARAEAEDEDWEEPAPRGPGRAENKRRHAGLRCTVFDVGYRHGHFQAAFDTRTKHDTITQVTSVMQLARYGWLQLVFRRADFTRDLQALASAMKSRHAEFTESKHQSTSDMLLSTSPEPRMRDHPEKKGDLASHYQALHSHLVQKAQDEQAMVSVRGLLESGHEVRLDWSGIGAAASQGSSFEHLTANEYGYAEFAGLRRRKNKVKNGRRAGGDADAPHGSDGGIGGTAAYRWEPALTLRVDGRKDKNCTRLRIFEDRLLPDASAIRKPVSGYVSKSFLLGRYGTRRSPPFVVMTLQELGLLLRLPDTDATPNLTITRQQILPQQQQHTKSGFCLGFFERARSVSCSDAMPDLAGAAPPPQPSAVQPSAAPAADGGAAGAGGRTWWEEEFDIDAAGADEPVSAPGPAPGPAPRVPDGPAGAQPHAAPDPMFGQPGLGASSMQGVMLSTDDIPTHIYMAGGTKSGKTTLIRCIAKHMEMANLRGTFPNSFIFIDPKGSDSYDFLRQCEPESYDAGNVTFLDPIETKFSINVLELPPYDGPEDRQVVVSQYVGYIMQMIEYWYQGSDAFVRLKRILDTLLQYVYLNNDQPTFLDLYDIIVKMQQNGTEMLVLMYKELGQPEEVLQQAIESVASMDAKSYEPALNRLEKFATDPVLRHMFCVRESTVKFEDLISPGSYVVIRLSPLNIPQHIITLTKQTLVIKMWFAVQERAQRVKLESERTQVLLALDEFQDLAGLPVIEAMLTQARSYGLGLLLAHQTTAQLDDNLFEVIIGNAGTQFVGRVSGRDAGRFGDAWDPAYSKELKQQLATQEYHHWTARLVAGGGESQPLPVQFWPVHIRPRRRSEEFLADFIGSQKEKYGSSEVGDSIMRQAENRSTRWLLNAPYAPFARDEWHVMCILKESGTPLMLKRIVERFGDGTTASDTVAGILKRMLKKNLLVLDERKKYVLPHAVAAKYLVFDPAAIGMSEDIPLSTEEAVAYYLGHRFFLCVAPQTIRRGKNRTDLIAYDYETSTPISVEVESYAEVHRHPEHVKLNMTKWRELGFEQCHVWSTHPGIAGVYDGLTDEQKEGVTVFLVDDAAGGGPAAAGQAGPSAPPSQPPPLQKVNWRRRGSDAGDDAEKSTGGESDGGDPAVTDGAGGGY